MFRARAEFLQDGEMGGRRVAFVLCESIAWVFDVHVHAICITRSLCENGGRRNEKGLRIAFYDVDGMGQRRYGKAVDEHVHERSVISLR